MIDSSGAAVLIDSYSPDRNQPVRDMDHGGSNNLELFRSNQSNGYTSITFSRPLYTGDLINDATIDNRTLTIIYAYGDQDGISSVFYPKHTVTGVAFINFFDTGYGVTLLPC